MHDSVRVFIQISGRKIWERWGGATETWDKTVRQCWQYFGKTKITAATADNSLVFYTWSRDRSSKINTVALKKIYQRTQFWTPQSTRELQVFRTAHAVKRRFSCERWSGHGNELRVATTSWADCSCWRLCCRGESSFGWVSLERMCSCFVHFSTLTEVCKKSTTQLVNLSTKHSLKHRQHS